MVYFVVIPLILSVFGGINYYIGLRGWQWLKSLSPLPSFAGPLYWTVFGLLALSFFLARFASGRLPMAVSDLITYVGSYWLAVFVYALQLLILIDLVRLLNRWLGFIPVRLIPDVNLVKYTGAAVLLVLLGLVLYGTWRARTPVVTEYAIAIPESAGKHKELHVVMLSDTHLGAINGNGRIREMVDLVNGLEPDLILVPGDIIDDDFRPFVERNMAAELSRMKAKLGTYGTLGNHDAGSENLVNFRAELQKAGIQLLVDEWVKVDDSFIVAGRNDSSTYRRGGGSRAPLNQILAGADTAMPVLLMDHQPNRLGDAVAARIDLQVSGHTHRGQIFPGSLFTSRIFEVDWGYLKKEATHFVVSLGYGTWGPPVRIGNSPEVVSIRLTFGP